MDTRKYIALDGVWDYTLDRNYENSKTWKKMQIPSNWYLQGLDHSGLVVFRKIFKKVKTSKQERIFLCFKGIDYIAEVFLNGVYLGKHEGYFSPFKFNITHLLKKKNELIVRVDSPFESPRYWPHKKKVIKGIFGQHDTRPGGWDVKRGQDKNSGGIWNNVSLMITNVVRTRWLQINSKIISEKEAALLITAKIEKLSSNEIVKVKIIISPQNFKSEKKITLTREVSLAREKDPIVFCVNIPDPKLWWCHDYGFPHLYKAEMQLYICGKLIDSFSQVFGIREIEIKEWVWFLNGKRIFIRGVNFIPTQWLSEYTNEKIKKDIKLLLNANVNAIRVHAHVNRKELYSECDKNGIIVWQDFALQWSYADDNDFIAKSVVQIREMAFYLMNHPSIVVWCCHNEPSGNKNKLTPILYAALKSIDAWRHIEMASELETHPYPGWYYGHYSEFAGLPCAPMITEFGAQALPAISSIKKFIPENKIWPPDWEFWGYHNFRYEQTFNVAKIQIGTNIEEFIKNSQEYQANLIKFAIENYRRAKHKPITGLFQFMFVDCWPSITWSVVDYFRLPKKGYESLKSAYQPVLVSLAVKREPLVASIKNKNGINEMFAFWDPRQSIWITNDTYNRYND
ncbi:beta-galactosidase, partial [Candidatus Dependentiae bacterium]|nr:beta-galactosidase [Candidatus Dependentiae bacterium]